MQERINRFWSENPGGSITTQLEKLDPEGKRVVVEARVYKKKPEDWGTQPDVTGMAMEIEGSSNVNRTSHIENCETSAIGRALANMGYAKDAKSRPSKQEMEKVQRSEAATVEAHKPAVGVKDDPMELVIPKGKYKGKKIGQLQLEEAEALVAALPAGNAFAEAAKARAATLKALSEMPPALREVAKELDLEATK